MKNYIKSAMDTLHALDFQLDHEDRKLRTDRFIFTHANSPDDRLTLNFRMSEQAARTVVQKARQIVGLATSDVGEKRAPRVNQREKLQRAAEAKQREAALALREAREAKIAAEAAAGAIERHRRDLATLMEGKRPASASAADIRPDDMLRVDEVADLTGVTEKAVRRAIDADRLTAYQCGKDIKVKGADVRAWLSRVAS